MIHKFLTNRINLTIFQCILYFIIGYVMGEYLTWEQLVIMFIIMLVIQMITRVKAIADGILIVQMLNNKFETQRGDLDKLDKDIDRLMKDSRRWTRRI